VEYVTGSDAPSLLPAAEPYAANAAGTVPSLKRTAPAAAARANASRLPNNATKVSVEEEEEEEEDASPSSNSLVAFARTATFILCFLCAKRRCAEEVEEVVEEFASATARDDVIDDIVIIRVIIVFLTEFILFQ
jgi:hypothetical protein